MTDGVQHGLNEAGGIIAGAVALLATIGGGLRWLLRWTERRQESRAAKLQRWHEELKLREQRLDAERENEIRDIRGELHALFQAYILLAGALTRIDPMNPALAEARTLLNMAFRAEDNIPEDMNEQLGRIRRTGERR